jgi:signal transduction histidine kinase
LRWGGGVSVPKRREERSTEMSLRLLAMILGSVIAPLAAALVLVTSVGREPPWAMPAVLGLVGLSVMGAVLTSILALAPVRRNLGRIAEAMLDFGEGDSPGWLPLPEGDAVGDLSLATGEMVSRIHELLRRVDEQSRLAVVGELASHIAHEIRNPLSSIHMNLQSIDRMLARGVVDDEVPEMIRVSLQEVRRLNAVVGAVLEMGRAEPPRFERASLHRIVDWALEVMGPEFRRAGIQVTWRPDCPDDEVVVDPKRIKGVLLNLFVNALEAQPQGGALRIATRPGSGQNGPSIDLVIADAGPGIPPSLRDRVFRPFFTTKPAGSGIGLAMSREALRVHQGELLLDVPETPASGATFRVVLPLTDPGADGLDPRWVETTRTAQGQPQGPFGSEAILG